MAAFLFSPDESRIRSLTWLGVVAALVLIAAFAYQWFAP
jgi:hypothetical protein